MDVDLREVSDDRLLYVLGYYVYEHVPMRSLTREVPGTNVTYQDVMVEANEVRDIFNQQPKDMLDPVLPEPGEEGIGDPEAKGLRIFLEEKGDEPEEEVVQHEEPLVIDPLV